MNLIGEISDATGRALAAKYDETLFTHLRELIGREADDDVLRRTERCVHPDGSEEILLDGAQIAWFSDIRVEHGSGEWNGCMVATRHYKLSFPAIATPAPAPTSPPGAPSTD